MKQQEIFDFCVTTNENEAVSLEAYRGKVLLIVNTASRCGFTPQYAGLQQLYEKYRASGLEILAFPCDQFGHQEPGTDEEIATFCSTHYQVTFPLMKKVKVNGADAEPLYRFLKEKAGGILNDQIKWNFTKFLVSGDGQLIKRYAPTTTPESIEADIQQFLSQGNLGSS